jgi:hypothetical protein
LLPGRCRGGEAKVSDALVGIVHYVTSATSSFVWSASSQRLAALPEVPATVDQWGGLIRQDVRVRINGWSRKHRT